MKTYKQLAILFLLPLLFLALLYGLTKGLNRLGDSENRFRAVLERDLSLPWSPPTKALISLDLNEFEPTTSRSNVNLALIIDNSGSMDIPVTAYWSRFTLSKNVVTQFVENLSGTPNLQVGVIFFGSYINHRIPLTSDLVRLKQELDQYNVIAGGTDFLPPLEEAGNWLAPKSGDNNFIVFLTDAQAGNIDQVNRFYREQLLARGVDVFMVGVGSGADFDNLREILRDGEGNVPVNRVMTCEDELMLSQIYGGIGGQIGNVIGKDGKLSIPFAHRSFAWRDPENVAGDRRPLPKPEDETRPFILRTPLVFKRVYQYTALYEPRSWGLIRPFHEKLGFRFRATGGETVSRTSGASPFHLNVTYWLLFFLYLPFLLYLLSLLGRWLSRAPVEKPLPPLVFPEKTTPTPHALPKRFVSQPPAVNWIPTLVLGLGRSGRQVLTQLKQNLADLSDVLPKSLGLLYLDVAMEEVDGPDPDRVPGVLVGLDRKDEIYIPEAVLRDVSRLVEQYRDLTDINDEDPFSQMDLGRYAQLDSGLLGLGRGTNRHAALARAYLVRELELGPGSPLLKMLEAKLAALEPSARAWGHLQIIIVANANGGTGSGLLCDLAVLLQRLLPLRLPRVDGFELQAVLLEDRENAQQQDVVAIGNPVLIGQLDALSQAGRLPQPYHLVRKTVADPEGFLRGKLTKFPFDNLYAFARKTEKPELDLFPEVADALVFLLEKSARIECREFVEGLKKLEVAQGLKERAAIYKQLSAQTLYYPVGLIRETIKYNFARQVLSDQIALVGLTIKDREMSLPARGNTADLLDHAETSPLFNQELDVAGSRWPALLRGEDFGQKPKAFAEDVDDFIFVLKKSCERLLNSGVVNLTGLVRISAEILLAFEQAQAGSSGDHKALERALQALVGLHKSATGWVGMLMGNAFLEPEQRRSEFSEAGFIRRLQERSETIEVLESELLAMGECRTVLGLDERTPAEFRPQHLLKTYLKSWLGGEDPLAALRQRWLWSIEPHPVEGYRLSLTFFGSDIFRFDAGPDETFLQKLDELAQEWSSPVGSINLLDILGAASGDLALDPLAERLKGRLEPSNLAHLLLFPASKRLSPAQEDYLGRLRAALLQRKHVSESFFFPPGGNHHRLHAVKIRYLLRGDDRRETESFFPFHLAGSLAELLSQTVRTKLRKRLPASAPYQYLIFSRYQRFELFVRLWLGERVVQTEGDPRWKLLADKRIYQLSFFDEEGLIDAAVRFVLSDFQPGTIVDLAPKPERLERLAQGVSANEPLFCWMRLVHPEDKPARSGG